MPLGFLSRRAPLRVQPFFGFSNGERLFLSARAMRSREPVFESRSFFGDVATMLGLYASNEVAGLEVTCEFATSSGQTIRERAITGPEGFARFDFALPSAHTPGEFTRWEQATLRWSSKNGEYGGGEATAHILTPGTAADLGVISDIDDTILETGITGNAKAILRNWKRVLAQMPSERAIVPGARDFYSALSGDAANDGGQLTHAERAIKDAPQARPRPVFYVSSSPWNLFSYLVTFKRQRGLPLGPVMLRDWGFNRKTLGSQSHGSHKREAIDRILGEFPGLRFALVGDDSQKDLVAFGDIAAAHPERVAAVFIRRVADEALSEAERNAQAKIEGAGVPFWSGSDYDAAAAFLRDVGLTLAGGVDRLVRTASEANDPAAESR